MDKIMEHSNHKWQPDWATHPGEHLAEYIETKGWSQAEFARMAGMSTKLVSTIISGDNPVSAETALLLERVLQVKASFWTNLQSNWNLYAAKKAEKIEEANASNWLKQFPIEELASRGFCTEPRNTSKCVNELLALLGIGKPSAVGAKIKSLAVQHRQAKNKDVSPYHILVWLMLGERKAQQLDLPPYDSKRFSKALTVIRNLTTRQPRDFEPVMIEECKMSGVALVFEKPISKTCLYGSARWLSSKKAIIQMSLRMKSNDHFWWTFFHEAGHIKLHEGSNFADDEKGQGDRFEEEADNFAREILVDRRKFQQFLLRRPNSKLQIVEFARENGIHPAIVVGMLQHERAIPFNHMNDLKEKFELVNKVEE